MSADEEKIKECYREMYCGMVQKNRKILDTVLDESFTLVHMTGLRQSKEEFIRFVENGTLNYYSAVHESITVSENSSEIRLTGKSLVTAAVFGGGKGVWRLRLDIIMKNENGCLLITYAAESTY